ncbi:MAG: hypothetical protein HYX84_09010 [Chloroflexi bacterium]|nr:hypothetical protein [Chloroflexota bacterium]
MTTNVEVKNYGSFRDSLKAPIHRWFTYPAGYSYRFVEAKIAENGLTPGSWVADPFLGTGTTSIAAKMQGINSLGIEAHSFVHWVASTKMRFECDVDVLFRDTQPIIDTARSMEDTEYDDSWPDLIHKCFSEDNLRKLYALRKSIFEAEIEPAHIDFFKLALTTTLRIVTTAGSGWPYIAPSKYAKRTVVRDAFIEFGKQSMLMLADLRYVQSLNLPSSEHFLIRGDAREFSQYAPPESINLIVTSPPYLNNYDYADRTRLETYFWGIYKRWNDITRDVRDRLIIAATTQIDVGAMNQIRECPTIRRVSPDVHEELRGIISQLTEMRRVKPGKKTYDYMVAGYFEDMTKVLQQAYTALKPRSQFILVLGDSAPYGVHVPTEEIIGRLAVAVGFEAYDVEFLRARGDKWANNTQRHKIPLRESILTIHKK